MIKTRRPRHGRSLFCVLATLLASAAVCADQTPPSIVLIVSDDQGYRDLGCFGSTEVLTPHLDRLAREGVRLTDFYVSWPACTPSRGSLLTGRYPQRNGLYDMIRNEAPDYGHRYTLAEYAVTLERIGGMDTRELLLPRLLSRAGYVSGIFGKWDLGSLKRYLPRARGFDDHWKWLQSDAGGGLFDLSQDIGETTDLSLSHPQKLAEMTARFDRWRGEMDHAEPRGPFRDY